MTLECVELTTGPSPLASIVWMHGLGADGHDFEPIVPALRPQLPCATRFVFPHAPVRPVTLNSGYPMRAWYDVFGFDRQSRQDVEGIRASDAAIREIISRENQRGVPNARIVLAGFSQGGAMAVFSGTRQTAPLAGIMALSCYLVQADRFAAEHTAASLQTPIFMAHGNEDELLPVTMGVQTRDLLQSAGYSVAWHAYPMAHSVSPEEVDDIGGWLPTVLAASA
jgi:phospholipase/carboxylesterase